MIRCPSLATSGTETSSKLCVSPPRHFASGACVVPGRVLSVVAAKTPVLCHPLLAGVRWHGAEQMYRRRSRASKKTKNSKKRICMNPEHAHLLPLHTTRIHSQMLSYRKFACLIVSVIMIANAERCPFQPAQPVAWGGCCSVQGRRHHVVSSSSCWIVAIMSHRRHHGASSSSCWIIAMPFVTTLGSPKSLL